MHTRTRRLFLSPLLNALIAGRSCTGDIMATAYSRLNEMWSGAVAPPETMTVIA